MASLRDIRKRIKSVKNTQKITKAMKMVSAAKLRRAQDRVIAARPYAEKIALTTAALAKRAELLGEAPHPLLVVRPESKKGGRVEVLLISSDRGQCGAFNSNVVRRAFRHVYDLRGDHREVRVSNIGRKGHEAVAREKMTQRRYYDGLLEGLSFAKATDVAVELATQYENGEIDALFIVYNEFVNAVTQRVVVDQVLPIKPVEQPADVTLVDYAYEPSRRQILSSLLPRQLATRLYRALLESQAAEHAARMSAMDNASKNAKEMVDTLTLFYNRARQAAITKELMEIIGGAEALKG